MGAKATRLGSCETQPADCYIELFLNIHILHKTRTWLVFILIMRDQQRNVDYRCHCC